LNLPAPDPLRELFSDAVDAARPEHHVAQHLPPLAGGRIVVVGAGKAAAGMARALEVALGDAVASVVGAVAVPHGTPCECEVIECIGAGHPVPDDGSVAAAERMRALVTGLRAEDQVIALFSGGGSALLCDPIPGLTLADKQALTDALLRSGAAIAEINRVRQAVSRIKGGRLAKRAAPARVHTLLVSDVVGDDPSLIASGPTVPATGNAADAEAILSAYSIPVPAALRDTAAAEDAPLRGGDPQAARCSHRIICSPMHSLRAAARAARKRGMTPLILGDGLEGEARELGVAHAGIALSVARCGEPVEPPAVLLSGGEATVTLGATSGHGGPNAEFLLALALALDGRAGIRAIACDTDGSDGSQSWAGAIITPDTLARARAAGLDPAACLRGHDAYRLFEALGDVVETGPTGTNVNDFRAIVIE
jgi:hydroxypyruvate reductase